MVVRMQQKTYAIDGPFNTIYAKPNFAMKDPFLVESNARSKIYGIYANSSTKQRVIAFEDQLNCQISRSTSLTYYKVTH